MRLTGKSSDGTLDFDIRVNIMNLIVSEDVKRRLNYVKVIGPGEAGLRGEGKATTAPNVTGGLDAWARKFCEDGSSIKQFVSFSHDVSEGMADGE